VGSSLLPWAHSKLAASPGPVKGLVGLDGGAVSSRGARSPFDPPTPRPATVAPSAAPRRGGGDNGGPAGSTGGPPTARRSAGTRAGGTGAAAPSGDVRHEPRRLFPRRPTRRASLRRRRARVSAQRTASNFFPVTGRGARNTSLPRSGAPVGGSAAPPAVRPCGGSSSASGGGGSGHGGPGGGVWPAGAAGREFVVRYGPPPIPLHKVSMPPEGGRGGTVPGPPRAPAPFLRSLPHRRQGDGPVPQRSCPPGAPR
jgi:hypothetical protein